MNAESRLALIRVKVARARKHLTELETEVASEGSKNSTVQCMKTDAQTGKVKPYFGPLPISSFNVLATAGDVIQNLRSALDHLAYQLAQVGNPHVEPSTLVSFPIAKSPKLYEEMKARKTQGMRQDAIDAIDALEPYKGGNEKLWFLHGLNNIDKHRLVLTVGLDHLFTGEFEGGFLLKATKPIFDVLTDSDTSGEETLDESEIPESTALLPALRELVGYVDGVILSFKPFLSPSEPI
jgi:hypothetical protein